MGGMSPDDLPEYLRKRIRVEGRHWLWTGSLSRGYGQIELTAVNGRRTNHRAHRLVWAALVGEPPEDLHHDGCPHKHCVAPGCLRPLTTVEHAALHGQEHQGCRSGHAWTPENTYVRKDTGKRVCRRCKADRQAKYDAVRRP